MAVKTNSFTSSPAAVVAGVQTVPAVTVRVRRIGISKRLQHRLTWTQLIFGFLLLECAVWSSRLSVRSRWAVAACIIAVLLTVLDRPSLDRLGLRLPTKRAAEVMFASGIGLAILMVAATMLIGGQVPANPTFPNWDMAWKYLIWAMLQEFMLQSFFFTRCEELFGSASAVWVAGTLFALAHLPNLILTTCTLFSGLVCCEMFRRYRSIYPLGIIHAVLGLALSSTIPEFLLQHMRVGIGYLQ